MEQRLSFLGQFAMNLFFIEASVIIIVSIVSGFLVQKPLDHFISYIFRERPAKYIILPESLQEFIDCCFAIPGAFGNGSAA